MAAGYHDWGAGEIVTAANVEDYLQLQTVMRFATTAARDTALASVLTLGLRCIVTGTGRAYTYNGSAWVVTGWFTAAGRVGGQWARNATQSIPATTLTAISWDNETYDNDNILAHHATTGTTGTTAMDGMYIVSTKVAPASPISYIRMEVGAITQDFVGSSVSVSGTLMMPVAAATGIKVYVFQPGGGAVNVTGLLFIHYLGP